MVRRDVKVHFLDCGIVKHSWHALVLVEAAHIATCSSHESRSWKPALSRFRQVLQARLDSFREVSALSGGVWQCASFNSSFELSLARHPPAKFARVKLDWLTANRDGHIGPIPISFHLDAIG